MNKKIRTMKSIWLVAFLATASAWTPADQSISKITRALGSGDASSLGNYFDRTVDLAVVDREDTYSRAEAIAVVEKFFRTHPPRSFAQVHQGVSRTKDAQYCIGNLSTDSGVFRVYIYLKSSGGQNLIQELRFDEE